MSAVLLYALVVLGVTWLAGLIPLAASWRQSHRETLTGFASGVLLGAAFLHMLPEAAQHSPHWIGPAALAGLLFVFLLERVIITHYCEHDHDACNHFEVIGYTFYVGLTLHSLIDGVVLGSGALIPALGPIVFVAIVAHKLPAVFSLSSILIASGFRQKRVLGLIALLSLTTPVGAFAAFYGLRSLDPGIWRIAMSVSAGTFLYVALVDLLPSIARGSRNWPKCVVALMLGLALMYGAGHLAHSAHASEHAHATSAPVRDASTPVVAPPTRPPAPDTAGSSLPSVGAVSTATAVSRSASGVPSQPRPRGAPWRR